LEASLWLRCVSALENELPEQQFNIWVRPLQSVQAEGALRLLAPNRFVVDWVRSNLMARLGELLRDFGLPGSAAISVEV
jgi:chromosomal replication initiator protein